MRAGIINFVTRIAILQPSDSLGFVPSGIDTFIRGILRWAPSDLEYLHIGATSDPHRHPIDQSAQLYPGINKSSFVPIVEMSAQGNKDRIPLTLRYIRALRNYYRAGHLNGCRVLDFHRIEPLLLFLRDPRPKNVFIHQDMAVLRDINSDILWRYAPWLYEFMEKRLLRGVEKIYAVRQTAVQRYQKTYPAMADKFNFTPTWFDPEIFAPPTNANARATLRRTLMKKLSIEGSPRLLVFAGRLDRQKDPELLVHAFAQAVDYRPDCHLLIIGDGTLRLRLTRQLVEQKITAKVSLLGTLPPSEIGDIFRAADFFVLSSAYEGMPFAVLEALACGLPVVTTDVGEIRLVVKDGTNGVICTPQSLQSLCKAIIQALDQRAWTTAGCVDAVAAYHPQHVLAGIYQNHRLQGAQSGVTC